MKTLLLITCIWLFALGGLMAQDVPSLEDTLEVYEELFDLEEPLYLGLKFNLKDYQKTREDEAYKQAEMTCYVSDSFQVRHPVRIRARGIYRRDHCFLPPFWLNIRYAGIEAEELNEIVKMKMVVRCKQGKTYDNYVLREYLVYKLYNVVSPYSFRVRLIRLKITDTGRKNKESEDWAFLIEPNKMLEKRLDGKMYKSDVLSMRTVNPRIMDLLAMFQYMIGNGDFSVTGRHNLKILGLRTPGPVGYVPVPYDFDYTGLVNTHYAIPGENLGIQHVRERYFLGPCRSEEMHQEVIEDLAAFREELIAVIMDFEYLEEEEKQDMVGYLESYFSQSENEAFIGKNILSTCR